LVNQLLDETPSYKELVLLEKQTLTATSNTEFALEQTRQQGQKQVYRQISFEAKTRQERCLKKLLDSTTIKLALSIKKT